MHVVMSILKLLRLVLGKERSIGRCAPVVTDERIPPVVEDKMEEE
tara:strand:+ start:709 stop:843 length:135 start_codon:yes stop_codon:yes gene_type:complete